MTLIEAIIYCVLLSFLVAGFIGLAYTVHEQNMRVFHAIEDAYHG